MTPSSSVTGGDHTLTEVARLCGCSVDAIRRYRDAGRFPTAFRHGDTPNAPWSIPVGDLVAAGLYTPTAVSDTIRPRTDRSPEPTPEDHLDVRLVEATRTIDYLLESNHRLLGILETVTIHTAAAPELGTAA